VTIGGRLGVAAAQYGPHIGAVRSFAEAAEEIGFDSLWVGDRLMLPEHPTELYGGVAPWPEAYGTFLDPLITLATVAARTERIRLGTNVLIAPLHTPVRLARELASLDVLSGGRLVVGLGVGWSRQEYAAAGVPWSERGARLEETLDVLAEVWSDGPAEHSGHFWQIDRSRMDPKPVQRPGPPVYLAGFAPQALERVGRRAAGWLPAGLPIAQMGQIWQQIRRPDHGLDSQEMIVRANVHLTETDLPASRRFPFTGSRIQVVHDIHAAYEAGAAEVFVDLQQTCTDPKHLLDEAALIHQAVRETRMGEC